MATPVVRGLRSVAFASALATTRAFATLAHRRPLVPMPLLAHPTALRLSPAYLSGAQPDIFRLRPATLYCDATVYNGVVHAVEVPESEDGNICSQTTSMLTLLEKTLVDAGSGKGRLLQATIYLVDMSDYDGMNEVWKAWLPAGCAPSRACVRVAGLARPGWRVEIAVTAAQAASKP
jgi:enamine deaminase RidA (YjgF/YER057c/UK114 family)